MDQQQHRIEIKSWQAVGVWKWKITQDQCPIDKQSLNGPCLNCETQAEQKEPCQIVQGECNHSFHKHCLDSWLQQHQTCPYCTQPWKQQGVFSR